MVFNLIENIFYCDNYNKRIGHMFTNLLGPLLYMNNFGDSWATYIY